MLFTARVFPCRNAVRSLWKAPGGTGVRMEPLDRLDASIQALVNQRDSLRDERERERVEIDELRHELVEARETIAGLRNNLEALGSETVPAGERDAGKTVIIERIQTLISRLDSLVHIENLTNDRQ